MANNEHRDQRRGDDLPAAVRPGTDLRHRIRERVLARRETFVAAALTGLVVAGCNETRDAAKTVPEATSSAVQPAAPTGAKPDEPAIAEPVDSSGVVPTGDLAEVCLSVAGLGAGSDIRISGPLVAKVEGITGNVPGVERSVNTALQDVGMCYVPAFRESTNALGSIDVVLAVGPKGEVLDVKHKAKGEVVQTVDCIVERLRMITFSAPEGPRGRVKFKLLFSKRG